MTVVASPGTSPCYDAFINISGAFIGCAHINALDSATLHALIANFRFSSEMDILATSVEVTRKMGLEWIVTCVCLGLLYLKKPLSLDVFGITDVNLVLSGINSMPLHKRFQGTFLPSL